MRPRDHVSFLIDEKLSNLRVTHPEHCIFKVHPQLRQVNEKAYEPEILAIGPYHHDKDTVQLMEEHKLRYLHQLLERRSENSVERYVVKLRELQERARNCYAESIGLISVDKFVEMMLLDGCFIIELFRKFSRVVPRDGYDPIFDRKQIFVSLQRDLFLYENQLPFFVLSQLFDMTKAPTEQNNLTHIASRFGTMILPETRSTNGSYEISRNEIKHLLGLIYNTKISSLPRVGDTRNSVSWKYIHSATELREAGVKFKKGKGDNLFDIKFKKGVMEIPPLKVDDSTESIFRNFIAYEQNYRGNHFNCFTDYMTFMDSLMNSSKDVELLRRRGIIENSLGDDEVVSTMFNKLGDNVIITKFCYADLFNNVNKHCSKRWNVRMANLRRNYFNSPWSFLSVLAAVLLLVLTIVQTIFSVLSYFSH